jgi:hypothetical protein
MLFVVVAFVLTIIVVFIIDVSHDITVWIFDEDDGAIFDEKRCRDRAVQKHQLECGVVDIPLFNDAH